MVLLRLGLLIALASTVPVLARADDGDALPADAPAAVPAPAAEAPIELPAASASETARPPAPAKPVNANDKVRLKNGQTLEGRILSERGGDVWIEAAPGSQILVSAAEIRSVERGSDR